MVNAFAASEDRGSKVFKPEPPRCFKHCHQNPRRKKMKRLTLTLSLMLLLCAAVWAQEPVTKYSFKNINYRHDTFTQLLGINNASKIAGYHNVNTNSGFTLVLPNHFRTENFPNSVQTQVIGINNSGRTDGFYIDTNGVTHGFFAQGAYFKVDYPGSAFNQLLGINDRGQEVGYYSMSVNNTTPDFPYIYDQFGGVFEVLTIPGAVGGAQATGINNSQEVCGFYIDSTNVSHGFLLAAGKFTTLDFPDSLGTQALGLNNKGQIVGFYTDSANQTHGFVFAGNRYVTHDDPQGVGTTVINGINDKGQLVGFYGTSPTNTGFVATPE
jgi:probable HAF family extracellular repeat protein